MEVERAKDRCFSPLAVVARSGRGAVLVDESAAGGVSLDRLGRTNRSNVVARRRSLPERAMWTILVVMLHVLLKQCPLLGATLVEDGGDTEVGDEKWGLVLVERVAGSVAGRVEVGGGSRGGVRDGLAGVGGEDPGAGDGQRELPRRVLRSEPADVSGDGPADGFDHVAERAARRIDLVRHGVQGVAGDGGVDPDRVALVLARCSQPRTVVAGTSTRRATLR